MTEVWEELAGSVGEQIAGELRTVVLDFENARDRSQQSNANVMGPSGIGSPCVRCLARATLGRPVARGFDDPWRRIVGTAVHAWLDEAALHANKTLNRAKYLSEMRVYPDGTESVLLPKGGNADLYMVDRRAVVDHKTSTAAKIKAYKHNGPGQQYRYQAHLYGRGLELAGHPVDHVVLLFWPRDGLLRDVYPWVEPYDEAVALEALARYANIRDLALAHGVSILPHLPADPDCWDCRGADVQPEELLSA